MLVGSVLGRIEFNQDLSPLDDLPVLYVDRGDHTRLIRLNHLGVAAGNNLALCRGDNVDPSQHGPQDAARKHGHDRP